MNLDEWYACATADADRRQLPDLTPVLKGLRGAANVLRAASWNDDATGRTEASNASTGSTPSTASAASTASTASDTASASASSPDSTSSPRASS